MNTFDHKNQKNIREIKRKRESNVDATYCEKCGRNFYYGSESGQDGIDKIMHGDFSSIPRVTYQREATHLLWNLVVRKKTQTMHINHNDCSY